MKIAIIGGGYVGLVSGACFAEFGVSVAVYEADLAKRAMLLQGRIPIYEPGLDKLVAQTHGRGTVELSGQPGGRYRRDRRDFHRRRHPGAARRWPCRSYLCVCRGSNRSFKALDHPAVIVTKSTVPVGTGRKIAEIAHRAAARP